MGGRGCSPEFDLDVVRSKNASMHVAIGSGALMDEAREGVGPKPCASEQVGWGKWV